MILSNTSGPAAIVRAGFISNYSKAVVTSRIKSTFAASHVPRKSSEVRCKTFSSAPITMAKIPTEIPSLKLNDGTSIPLVGIESPNLKSSTKDWFRLDMEPAQHGIKAQTMERLTASSLMPLRSPSS